MVSIRLGLIADTHLSLLPYEAIESAFRDVDGILHAGDIQSQEVLDELSGIAPIKAVRGEVDTMALPDKRVLTFGDVRVGLIHGHRHPFLEHYFQFQRRMGNLYAGGRHLLDSLPSHFEDDPVDVIVFGHLHTPMCFEQDGLLLVNPGAVYGISPDDARWQLLYEMNPHRRVLLENHIKRFRNRSYRQHPQSTVGILDIHADKRVRVSIRPLPMLAYS